MLSRREEAHIGQAAEKEAGSCAEVRQARGAPLPPQIGSFRCNGDQEGHRSSLAMLDPLGQDS